MVLGSIPNQVTLESNYITISNLTIFIDKIYSANLFTKQFAQDSMLSAFKRHTKMYEISTNTFKRKYITKYQRKYITKYFCYLS